MDSEEDIGSARRHDDDSEYLSNIQNSFSHLQRNKGKSKSRVGNQSLSSSSLKIAGIMAVSLFIILVIYIAASQISQITKRVIAIESTNGKNEKVQDSQILQPDLRVQNNQSFQQEIRAIINNYEQRIKNLERKLQKLELGKVQSGNRQEKEKPLVMPDNTLQTGLVSSIQKQFQDFKITINFLHEHDRQTYYYQKLDFLRSCSGSDFLRGYGKAKESFMQAINNFKLPHFNINLQKQRNEMIKNERDRLSREYDFNLPEIPFCIVVPTLNNAKNFRYQYNLQSMVNLDYKNFKIVIIDDASTDYTYELILQWIEDNQITHNIVVLKNEKRLSAVPNIYTAVTQHCDPNDVVVLVDGDDELLGRNALKIFSHLYQKNNADVVYSNHLQFYTHTRQVYRGWSMSYSDDQKRSNRYRDVPQRIAHLRSFKAKLFLKIKEEDMKDKNGQWFTSTYDEVICLPILEMSCGKIVYVEEFLYLYNFGIGTNDLQVDQGLQKSIADEVKYRRKKYQCLKQ